MPASGGNPPRGILLGGTAGVQYIEPAAAVPANNELTAARGEVGNVSSWLGNLAVQGLSS